MATTMLEGLAPIVAATVASDCHAAQFRNGYICSECGDKANPVPVWLIEENCGEHKHIHAISIDVLNSANN